MKKTKIIKKYKIEYYKLKIVILIKKPNFEFFS